VRGDTTQVICTQKPLRLTVPQSTDSPRALTPRKLIVPTCEPGEVQVSRMVTGTRPPGGTVTGSAGLTTVNAELLDVIVVRVNARSLLLTTVTV